MQYRQAVIFVFALVLVWLETYILVWKEKQFDIYNMPLQLIGIQILIASCLLIPPLSNSPKKNILESLDSFKKIFEHTKIIGLFLISCLGLVKSFHWFSILYQKIPIDPKISDIIPLIEKMTGRFVNGQYPYALVTDFGYDLPPTYLPAQWMPYTLAKLANFDIRWVSWGVFMLATLIFIYFVARKVKNLVIAFILSAAPFIWLYLLQRDAPYNIGITVELLTAAYYLILGVAIFSKSIPFRALIITLCLMSRFSFLFWLPLYFFILWHTEGKKKTITIGTIVAIISVFWYGIFLVQDPSIFFKAQKAYTEAAIGEWERNDFSHLQQGLGLAIWFKSWFPTSAQAITAIQKTLFIATPLLSLILGFIFWKNKNNWKPNTIQRYNLFALKLSLTCFYAFIQVPYSYLFFVPLMISFIILVALSETENKKISC